MPSTCRNCGEPAPLRFCPACGQETQDPRRPALSFLGDFLSEFFSLDGRHLRTGLALLSPGRLTRLYLDGKRASYAKPVRVYFVASLLFFLLVGFPAPDASRLNVYIEGVLVDREERDPKLSDFTLTFDRDGWLERLVVPDLSEKTSELTKMPAQEVLDRVFTGLERNVPTALIALVPILALTLKLVFWRRRSYYIDHLIFALHFQSFLFLALLAASFANALGLARLVPGLVTYLAVFGLIAPVYLVVAVKRIYEESWLWTILKCGAIALLYLFLIQPVVLVTFAMAVSGA